MIIMLSDEELENEIGTARGYNITTAQAVIEYVTDATRQHVNFGSRSEISGGDRRRLSRVVDFYMDVIGYVSGLNVGDNTNIVERFLGGIGYQK